jgi:hypothetical protein
MKAKEHRIVKWRYADCGAILKSRHDKLGKNNQKDKERKQPKTFETGKKLYCSKAIEQLRPLYKKNSLKNRKGGAAAGI